MQEYLSIFICIFLASWTSNLSNFFFKCAGNQRMSLIRAAGQQEHQQMLFCSLKAHLFNFQFFSLCLFYQNLAC